MTKRRILYVTGTRADFGLMARTLKAINSASEFDLQILVTGMHLSEAFGLTVNEIKASGFKIVAEVPIDHSINSGARMARSIGEMLIEFSFVMERERPDVVMLLGDRGEMLAAAIAAIHENIAIVHIHGGERSGTVDEPVRHAISKLAHFHFTSTNEAKDRLIRMGERSDHVWQVGAPGVDGLIDDAVLPRSVLIGSLRLNPSLPIALLVHHPVVQDISMMASETQAIIEGLLEAGCQIVALNPNSDAGGESVRKTLAAASSHHSVRVVTHFPRNEFVSWMSSADLMIGNSSAGIIEAGTFGTPVINIGSRQNMRERNANVTDVPVVDSGLSEVIRTTLSRGRFETSNIYGDGASAPRIAALLAAVPLDAISLRKCNAY